MRIVYLNPGAQMGGAETSLRELLASLRKAKPEWDLWLVLGEDGPLVRIAEDLGVHAAIVPFPLSLARLGDAGQGPLATLWSLLRTLPAAARYASRLSAKLRGIKPDLVHTNGFKMHVLGIWTRPRNVPVIWHIHDYVRSRPLMSRLLRAHQRRRLSAIANSRSVAADLRALMPQLDVTPIYNAVNLDRFAPTGSRLDLDAISGLPPAPPGTMRVGLVATFARWKGHKVFLQALSRLSPDLPIRGYIIGGPIYHTNGSQWSMSELKQEAMALEISGRVGFTGILEDSSAAMRELDIVVHASTQAEPFGMVIIEGMACGRAVVAARGGGASELIVEEENALAHPAGDAVALAAQIQRLALDPALRRRLGETGRQMAEHLYSGERLGNEVLSSYQKAWGGAAWSDPETLRRSSLGAAGD